MGNRLSKIYTRTGDDGSTGLADGSRTPKDSLRITAIGSVDELNSQIGLLAAQPLPVEIHAAVSRLLSRIQHELFNLGGELSVPGMVLIESSHVSALEQALDEFNAPLAPLKDFILPGGSPEAAICHVARAVCRRAERDLISLRREQPEARAELVHYLNRLSDLLFVLARAILKAQQRPEVLWQKDGGQQSGQ